MAPVSGGPDQGRPLTAGYGPVGVGDGVGVGVGEAVVGVGLGLAAFCTTLRVICVLAGTRCPECGF